VLFRSDGVPVPATDLFPALTPDMLNQSWTNVVQTESDANGHLLDSGLSVSLLACSASAKKTKPGESPISVEEISMKLKLSSDETESESLNLNMSLQISYGLASRQYHHFFR